MRQCVNCVKDGVEIKVVQTFQLRDQRQKDVAILAIGHGLQFEF